MNGQSATANAPLQPLTQQAPAQRFADFAADQGSSALREHWKYTRLQPFSDALTNTQEHCALNVTAHCDDSTLSPTPIQPAAANDLAALRQTDVDWGRYPLADGLFSNAAGWQLDVPNGARSEAQLTLGGGQGYGLVHLGRGAQLQATLQLTGTQPMLGALLFDVGADAQLTLDATALENCELGWLLTQLRLQQGAQVTVRQYLMSAGTLRLETHVLMNGPGAHAELSGASIASSGGRLDQQLTVEHRAAQATSHQRYHCVGQAASKSNFNGRIHIHAGAKQTLAELSNRNLALSADAELNTKPELEIYNDDVRCAHGATVGQLDNDALFYCQARGIAQAQARQMLTVAFLRQCVGGPAADAVQQAIEARIQ